MARWWSLEMSAPAALIRRAVAALARGELVAFPTETVYGLGADAANPAAIARLYALKGRPSDHPVIVHIVHPAGLAHWVREISPPARALVAACWPGPLTLVLPRARHVLDAVTGGQDTVAVRCPAHPLAQALLAACAARGIYGLGAPSANRFGRISPTQAAHVHAEFGAALEIVLDGGACAVGIESTIVDVVGAIPRVLRPGMLDEAQVARIVGNALGAADAPAPRVPGALPAHYAPRTPLVLGLASACVERAVALLARQARPALFVSATTLAKIAAPGAVVGLVAPATASAYARVLYASLRELDGAACAEIIVELPPSSGAWRGIHDRLARAACGAPRAAT